MPSTIARFTFVDWSVVVLYFVSITAFGLWIARRIRSSQGYFLGDRQLPWWVMVGQSFGTGTHAENPVAQAGAVYRDGFSTIWFQWKNMLITPFYWLMAPWYRRCERTTIGEMVEDRFGHGLAFLYTVFALCYFVFNQGTMLKGAGKVISVSTGGMISDNGVVVAMTVAFILYSFFGGLIASAYTDFIQGLLIIVMSFLLIPLGLNVVGGFTGMRETLPQSFFQLYSEVSGIDAWMIAMLTLNGLIGITAQPHILTMNATGRTERAGRVGQTYGSMVKRFCTIGWAFTGLIAAAMIVQHGTNLVDKEHAFGYACLHLLAPLPGMLGLMVACILAANMSTCSNFMVNSGALFTRNLYQRYLRPEASDREVLRAGRLSGFGLTLGGVVFALYVDQVLDAFLFNETLPCVFGVAILGGILWRRTNRYGALAGIVAALFVYYALNFLMTSVVDNQVRTTPLTQALSEGAASLQDGTVHEFIATHKLKLVYRWLPAPFGWAMLAGFGALVLVSLVTPREDPERIRQFFDNMNRTTDDEPGIVPGQPKPLAASRGQDLILLDLTGWFTVDRWRGFFHRYREDLVGFILAWASVGVMVLVAWAIMQIGK